MKIYEGMFIRVTSDISETDQNPMIRKGTELQILSLPKGFNPYFTFVGKLGRFHSDILKDKLEPVLWKHH
jgi:hypothetical protein